MPLLSGVSTGLSELTASELGVRWLLTWKVDVLGDCCCLLGKRRGGGKGVCARPGKHPWKRVVDGESDGFTHGALDAVDTIADLVKWRTAGNRLSAVPGKSVMVVDLDSRQALMTWARIEGGGWVPDENRLGVAKSPRGYHVWLRMDSGDWTQAAALEWMRLWLKGHWTTGGLRGLDLRCGERSYVVWPEEDGGMDGRWWLSDGKWAEVLGSVVVPGTEIPEKEHDWGPPWLIDRYDDDQGLEPEYLRVLRDTAYSAQAHADDRIEVIRGLGLEWAALRMEQSLEKFRAMAPGSGRNNRLNQIAFFQGSALITLGADWQMVETKLVDAAKLTGTHGIVATVKSGLRAGVRMYDKAKAAGA